jgi:hypothetical protein
LIIASIEIGIVAVAKEWDTIVVSDIGESGLDDKL